MLNFHFFQISNNQWSVFNWNCALFNFFIDYRGRHWNGTAAFHVAWAKLHFLFKSIKTGFHKTSENLKNAIFVYFFLSFTFSSKEYSSYPYTRGLVWWLIFINTCQNSWGGFSGGAGGGGQRSSANEILSFFRSWSPTRLTSSLSTSSVREKSFWIKTFLSLPTLPGTIS